MLQGHGVSTLIYNGCGRVSIFVYEAWSFCEITAVGKGFANK